METNKHRKLSLREQVLAKIQTEKVTMRPRIFFMLKLSSLVGVALVVLVLSVSILSYILFSIRASSAASLVYFGPSGWWAFIQFFPWWLLLADLGSIILLQWMLRQFRFGYRSPILYLLVGLVVVVGGTSVFLDQHRFNDQALLGARDRHVPLIGGFYDQGKRPPGPREGGCRCTITAILGNTLQVLDIDPDKSTPYTIVLPAGTATSSLYVGEVIFVGGHAHGNTIDAYGVDTRLSGPRTEVGNSPQIRSGDGGSTR